MPENAIVVKQSPFVFLRNIAIAEFFVAVLPLFVAAILNVQLSYEGTAFSRVLPYGLLLALLQTLAQFLIVGATFAYWYLPTYRIGVKAVTFQRGPFYEDKTLVAFPDLRTVEVHQGMLGRRFDYGDVQLTANRGLPPARMRNIANPSQYAELLLERTARQPLLAPPPVAKPLPALIGDGEGQHLEFKASLMWDYRKQSVNKELYEPVMKNLVGFMNTAGGVLLIGVGDDGAVLGIEPDMGTLKKPNTDGFENVFNVAFANMVGVENRQFVSATFPTLDGKTLCMLDVQPATYPVYLTYQGKEEFYIRAGNASQALTVSKAAQYIQSRFGNNG
jgi:membrane protein YdbS with pleckstrin-like domain